MKKISRRALFGMLIPMSIAQQWPPAPPADPPTLADLAGRVTLVETAVMVGRWRDDNAHMRLKILEACYSYCGVIPEIEGKL